MKNEILIHCGKERVKRDLLIEWNCFSQDIKMGRVAADKPYQLLSEPLTWKLYKN